MNEELMKKLFEESESLFDDVMKQYFTFDDISSITSEELGMLKRFMDIYKTFKDVSLSMARTLDRQNEVLKKLDKYLDHQNNIQG